MKKAKLLIATLTLSLVALLSSIFALTGAWFTHNSDVKTATISVGEAVTMTIDGTFRDITVLPGDTVENFISAKAVADANTSSMYVRAYVQIQGDMAEVLSISSAGDDWVKYGDYFYYTKTVNELTASSTYSNLTILNKAEETTPLNLSVEVSFDATEETLIPNSTVECKVIFQAIQSKNTGSKKFSDNVDWGNNPIEGEPETENKAIPRSGYVETVYFNTSLSTQEVVSILDNITAWHVDSVDTYYSVFESENLHLYIYKDQSEYMVVGNYYDQFVPVFFSAEGNGFVGWYPELPDYIDVQEEGFISEPAHECEGSQNELLKNLFSIEPFEKNNTAEGTAIPNSGYLNKLYINTDLSTQKVVSVLEKITNWSQVLDSADLEMGGYLSSDAYIVAAGDQDQFVLVVGKDIYKAEPDNVIYTIAAMVGSDQIELFSTRDGAGWNQALGEEMLTQLKNGFQAGVQLSSSYYEVQIGTDNELLKELFYTTANDVTVGTAIPNEGLIENVYINTSLSVQSVCAIFDNITEWEVDDTGDVALPVYYVLQTENLTAIVVKAGEDYIFGIQYYGNTIPLFVSNSVMAADYGFPSAGWNPEMANMLALNEVAFNSGEPYEGTQNHLLADVFSITPFVNSVGVPNVGYVEDVYFNTELSIEEVRTIVNQLSFYDDATEGLNGYLMLTADDGNGNSSDILIIKGDNGEFFILYSFSKQAGSSGFTYLFSSAESDLGFVGWNPEINGATPIEINNTVSNTYVEDGNVIGAGDQNNLLVQLFNITPFN